MDDILRGAESVQKKPSAVWVPAFRKQMIGYLNWLKGLEITATNGDVYYIDKALEGFEISMDLPAAPEGSLIVK